MATVASLTTKHTGPGGNDSLLDKPSGTVSGDLLFAHVTISGLVTVTAPAGWTVVQEQQATSPDTTVGTYKKIAGGSEPSTYDFTFSSTTSIAEACMLRITGSAASPIGASSKVFNSSASTTATGTTITPVNSESLLLFCVSNGAGGTVSGYTITTSNPTWTEAYDASYGALAYATRPEITATGAATATLSGSSESVVIMVSINGNTTVSPPTGFLVASGPAVDPQATQSPISVPVGLISLSGPVAIVNDDEYTQWTDQSQSTAPTWTDQSIS